MTTWKHAEREIARLLGGKRSGPTGVSQVDVEHDELAIEVKHRKAAFPKWINRGMEQANEHGEKNNKIPILVVHEHGTPYLESHVIMSLQVFKKEFLSPFDGSEDANIL